MNFKELLFAIAIPFVLAGLGIITTPYIKLGYSVISTGVLVIPVIYLINRYSKVYIKAKRTFDFLSQLEHCQNLCATTKLEWPFGNEIKILKTLDKILEKAVEKIHAARKGDTVYLITNHFNLNAELWRLLMEKSRELQLKIIVNKDSISESWRVHFESLSKNASVINRSTDGIRLFLVKDRYGYICNSESIKTGNKPEDYIALYSENIPWLKSIEAIFEHTMNRQFDWQSIEFLCY